MTTADRLQELQALRLRIAQLQREHLRLTRPGERNREQARAENLAFAERAAAMGRQRLAHLVTTGDLAEAFRVRPGAPGSIDLAPLLAALLGPKAFTAALDAQTAQMPPAPDAAEHARALAAVADELDRLEHREEDLTEALEAVGTAVVRRADARPEIVLRAAP